MSQIGYQIAYRTGQLRDLSEFCGVASPMYIHTGRVCEDLLPDSRQLLRSRDILNGLAFCLGLKEVSPYETDKHRRKDLNLQPSVLETVALPIELRP